MALNLGDRPSGGDDKKKWLMYAVIGGGALAFITILRGNQGGGQGAAASGSLTPNSMIALGSLQQQILELQGKTGQSLQTLTQQVSSLGLTVTEQSDLLAELNATIDPLTGAIEGFG